ncbi:MAG: hypothetical protein K1X86_06080 [Ignavibacteria bacterium]|nr:hypothetical protein [Ignavibacteria bacterium]
MKKILILGENEKLNDELKHMFYADSILSKNSKDFPDIIFETTNINREIKFNNLKFIDDNYDATTPVISSSLCIPVLEQSVESWRPERIIGAALYPTFSEVKGIEIARTHLTDEHIFAKVKTWLEYFKQVHVAQDRAGLIHLRIILLIINEAYLVWQEGTSNEADIDTAMRLGTNYPYGPIDWSKRIGVDLVYHVLNKMNDDFKDDRYRITPLLKEKYLEHLITAGS